MNNEKEKWNYTTKEEEFCIACDKNTIYAAFDSIEDSLIVKCVECRTDTKYFHIGEIVKEFTCSESNSIVTLDFVFLAVAAEDETKQQVVENVDAIVETQTAVETAQKNLQILALNLEDELCAISCDVIALNDIGALVSDLRVKMDNIEEKNARLYFREFHRSVRVLDELSVRAVDNLNKNYEAAEEIKQGIFDNTRVLHNGN